MNKKRITFWEIYRFILVISFLYLIGDAIYRWSGFRYYSDLSKFLPSFALVSVFLSIVLFVVSVIVYVSDSILIRILKRVKIRWNEYVTFINLSIFSGFIVWLIKLYSIPRGAVWYEELIALSVVTSCSAFLSFRHIGKISKIYNWLKEGITPLVLLFNIWIIVSVVIVANHLWDTDGSKRNLNPAISGHAQERTPDIILITFDALSARDVSLYGYERNTTPFIDEWAKDAVVFTRAYSASNLTRPTTSSLMTGKRVWTHKAYYNIEGASKPINGKRENIPLLLKRDGYITMSFVANQFAAPEKLGIEDGFRVNVNLADLWQPGNLTGIIERNLYRYLSNKFTLYNWIVKEKFLVRAMIDRVSRDLSVTEFPPDTVFEQFFTYFSQFKKNNEHPIFAWIHLFPPHSPYLPPSPYRGLFDYKSDKHNGDNGYFAFKRARYDEFVRYCDDQFHNFIEKFNKIDDGNTVIILSSDHGESFEHNYLGHGGIHLYEQVTKIPLVMKWSDRKKGRILNNEVEQIDIPATILDLAHVKKQGWMEGRSLLPLLNGHNLPPNPVLSMSLYRNAVNKKITKGTIALWHGDYKLIFYIDKEKPVLFDIKNDPDELHDTFNQYNVTGNRLLEIIKGRLSIINSELR